MNKPNNYIEEENILAGTHPLSHYFSKELIVVYDEVRPVGRALLIYYPKSTEAFIGYYECIDNDKAAALLFTTLRSRAKKTTTAQTLTGPYNASFWLTYRLKLDQFGRKPYMSEPLSKPYYKDQFIHNGLQQRHTYISNEYGLGFNKKEASEFDNAARRARSLSYTISSPKPSEFTDTLSKVYRLITVLYDDFPGYKPITEQEFLASFNRLRHVIDYSFVKFAYAGDELAGFAVAFPDYGNLLYRPMTPLNKLRITLRRRMARRYVITYIGVLPEHSGLSKALLQPIIASAIFRGARIIGALALEDKVTASYAKSRIKRQYRYALFEGNL